MHSPSRSVDGAAGSLDDRTRQRHQRSGQENGEDPGMMRRHLLPLHRATLDAEADGEGPVGPWTEGPNVP